MSYRGSLDINRATFAQDLYSIREELVVIWNDKGSTGELVLTREIINEILNGTFVHEGQPYNIDNIETIDIQSESLW